MLFSISVSVSVLAIAALSMGGCSNSYSTLQPGDIVFQSSPSSLQGQAVTEATDSPYTHCGIVCFDEHHQAMVLEAVGPVRVSPLKDFISHSAPGTFCAKRLKQPVSAEAYSKAAAWATAQVGKSYDASFRWSDDELYCSELVWKTYAAAGVRLCEPRPFKSYYLDQPTVKQLIQMQYGSVDALPLNELAVAPGDLAKSPLLKDVELAGKK